MCFAGATARVNHLDGQAFIDEQEPGLAESRVTVGLIALAKPGEAEPRRYDAEMELRARRFANGRLDLSYCSAGASLKEKVFS
jgi:hypothetical protein